MNFTTWSNKRLLLLHMPFTKSKARHSCAEEPQGSPEGEQASYLRPPPPPPPPPLSSLPLSLALSRLLRAKKAEKFQEFYRQNLCQLWGFLIFKLMVLGVTMFLLCIILDLTLTINVASWCIKLVYSGPSMIWAESKSSCLGKDHFTTSLAATPWESL